MKSTFFCIFSGFIFSCFTINTAAQSCLNNNDLLSIPGSLEDHNHAPIGGGSFSATEKTIALKTLIAAENICKKNFSLNGGEASSMFTILDDGYYDTYKYKSYKLKIGFYQYVCVNGQKAESKEYTVDFGIDANPRLEDLYNFANNPGVDEFYVNRAKLGYLPIPLFRYLIVPASIGEAISSGNGFFDDTKGNDYYQDTDVYRNWFLTKPGAPVLLTVSRKEFLESLLEFYDREKQFFTKRLQAKIAESQKYMVSYQQSGNKAMYQSHLENKTKAEKELSDLENIIGSKKRSVQEVLLNESASWLQEPASFDPRKPMQYDNRNPAISMSYGGFFQGPNPRIMYRINPVVAAQLKSQTAKPVFFRVQFRYKSAEKFSNQIADGFVKQFDWNSLRKLL